MDELGAIRDQLAGVVIAYIRVSTARQGRSGLGLEAQRRAITEFCEREGSCWQDLRIRIAEQMIDRPANPL